MDNVDRDDLEKELINSSVMGFLLAIGSFVSYFFSNGMEFSKDYRMTLSKELYWLLLTKPRIFHRLPPVVFAPSSFPSAT